MKIIKLLGFKVLILIFINAGLYAEGLLTPFTEARLTDVEPGKRYKLRSVQKKDFKIKNTSGKKVTVLVEVIKSAPNTIKEDYEVIPDINWIEVNKSNIDIRQGSWGETELYLRVPERKEYFGKNYQAIISVRTSVRTTESDSNLTVGLKSNVYISVKEKEGFMRKIFGWLW